VVASGTPEDLLEAAGHSYTGEYLHRVLGDERQAPVPAAEPKRARGGGRRPGAARPAAARRRDDSAAPGRRKVTP